MRHYLSLILTLIFLFSATGCYKDMSYISDQLGVINSSEILSEEDNVNKKYPTVVTELYNKYIEVIKTIDGAEINEMRTYIERDVYKYATSYNLHLGYTTESLVNDFGDSHWELVFVYLDNDEKIEWISIRFEPGTKNTLTKKMITATFEFLDTTLSNERATNTTTQMLNGYTGNDFTKSVTVGNYISLLSPVNKFENSAMFRCIRRDTINVKPDLNIYTKMTDELYYDTVNSLFPKVENKCLFFSGTVTDVSTVVGKIGIYKKISVKSDYGVNYFVSQHYEYDPIDVEIGKKYIFYGRAINNSDFTTLGFPIDYFSLDYIETL